MQHSRVQKYQNWSIHCIILTTFALTRSDQWSQDKNIVKYVKNIMENVRHVTPIETGCWSKAT